MHRLPLRILVLFHPESDPGRQLAMEIYRRFMASGGSPGLRIPVAFSPIREGNLPPDAIDADSAEHTLVVALVDDRMAWRARSADSKAADAWAALIAELVIRLNTASSPHGLLPFVVDRGGLGLTAGLKTLKDLQDRSFVRLDRFDSEPARKPDELCFQVAVSALQLLATGHLSEVPTKKAPIQLFVSHAKADLPDASSPQEGPVYELLDYLAKGRVDGWYDAKKIDPGLRFDEALENAVKQCDVVVCVLTDTWSDREWCRREVLITKRNRRPLLVVDALESDVPRLFPYLGNARTLRWTKGRARAVVLGAVLEALRYRHAEAVLERRRRDGDAIIGVQPETLTLLRLPPNTRRVVYPDPPLPQEELEELLPVLTMGGVPMPETGSGGVTLTTPLSEVARWSHPEQLELVGLSLSGATDIEAWGGSSEHLGTLADDLTTMLLIAGIRLAYGGAIAHGGAQNDSINYTTRLFGLVRSYMPRAKELMASRIHPIVNFVSWPRYCGFTNEQLKLYGQEATLHEGPRPGLPDGELVKLAPDKQGYFSPDTDARRWAYARGLTEMRKEMGRRISARIALAGKLDGYSGLLPGVLEEILIARFGERHTPLYLIGAFGGATRYAIDLLEGRPRPEAQTAWVKDRVEGYAQLVAEYERRKEPIVTPEDAAAQLRELGRKGPKEALDNGLDDEQNRELFVTTDSYRITELILTGLKKRFEVART